MHLPRSMRLGFAWVVGLALVVAGCDDSDGGPSPVMSFRVSSGTSGGSAPWGVAVDGTGRIVVSELFGNRTDVFDSVGRPLGSWGSPGPGEGQFNWPKYVDVDDAGNIYVADNRNHRIQKFSPTGAFLGAWGEYGGGDGQFIGPTGIAVDSARGVVYVADSNNDRIETFDLEGNYLSQWGSRGTGNGQFRFVDPSGGSQGPEGDIALDAEGNVFVVDNWNQRVQKFSPTGAFLAQFGSAGTGDAQFLHPSGITVTPDGNIVVTDATTASNEPGTVGKVKVFDPSGAFLAELVFPPRSSGPASPIGVDNDAAGLLYLVIGESIEVYESPVASP